MDGALRAVDQHPECRGRAPADDLIHRHDGAERVRHLRDRDDFGARTEQFLEFIDRKLLLVHRRPLDHGAAALAMEVPGHDVGMMLHDRKHDLVAGLDALAAESGRDEIDRLGGVAGEDDLLGPRRIEKGPHLLARALVGLGRRIGEEVQAAMHVGVFVCVGLLDAIGTARGFCAEAALSR